MKKTIVLMLSLAVIACASKQLKLEDECVYSPQKTQFAFWSNVAEQMEVRIYNDANDDTSLNDANDVQTVALTKGVNDFWTATVKGDLVGKYYTVRSFQNGEWGLESPGLRVYSPKRLVSTARKRLSLI